MESHSRPIQGRRRSLRKLWAVIAAVPLLFAGLTVWSSAQAASPPTLRQGITGSCVAHLQRQVGTTPDGVFGPRTRAAVVAFQRARGLFPDGIVGPKTWSRLKPCPRGSTAQPVRAVRAGAARHPVPGARISSGFGPRWGGFHYGLDFAAPLNTPIYAAMGGVVIHSGFASGFGRAIYIRTADGHVNVYGHMRTLYVGKGARVATGQRIALVGNEGQSTGPHCHFEVHRNGKKIDPRPWLAARGVRV